MTIKLFQNSHSKLWYMKMFLGQNYGIKVEEKTLYSNTVIYNYIRFTQLTFLQLPQLK